MIFRPSSKISLILILYLSSASSASLNNTYRFFPGDEPDEACRIYDKVGEKWVLRQCKDPNVGKFMERYTKVDERPDFRDALKVEFQVTHFGVKGRSNLALCHRVSWASMRCIFDKLFETAYNGDTTAKVKENYDAIEEFINKLFYLDEEAIVNYGPWIPPFEPWDIPQHGEWWEQSSTFKKTPFTSTYNKQIKNQNCITGQEVANKWECMFAASRVDSSIEVKNILVNSNKNAPKGCFIENSSSTKQLRFNTAPTPKPDAKKDNVAICNVKKGYMSPNLVQKNVVGKNSALDSLGKLDFSAERKNPNDQTIKDNNKQHIRNILIETFNAPANLRYGDISSNSRAGKCFDPMGNAAGTITKTENDILSVHKDLIDVNPTTVADEFIVWDGFYLVSSSGNPDYVKESGSDVKWFIKCLDNSGKCYRDTPFDVQKGKECMAEEIPLTQGPDTISSTTFSQHCANTCAGFRTLPCKRFGVEHNTQGKKWRCTMKETNSDNCDGNIRNNPNEDFDRTKG